MCFGHLLCPSLGVFHCTFGNGNFHAVLITASKQSQDGTAVHFYPDSAWKRSSNPAWNLPVPNVQWKTPDDGQRRCPKHVEFYNKISVGFLTHLVGCFIWSTRKTVNNLQQFVLSCTRYITQVSGKNNLIFFCFFSLFYDFSIQIFTLHCLR